MKQRPAPLLEHITRLFLWPVEKVLSALYVHEARVINQWYTSLWRWNGEDVALVDFIGAQQEAIDGEHDAELEEAYERYVDKCRAFGIVPIDYIDRN